MAGYLLDTNVLSELLKKRPEPAVVRSLNVIPSENLYTSSVCVMELRHGCRRHDRPDQLWERIRSQLLVRVQILAFGEKEAVLAGDIWAALEAEGTPIGTEDVVIAATALAHGLTLASRNLRHFSQVKSLSVVNWWA